MNRGKLLNPLTFHVSLSLVQTLSTTSSIGTLRLKSRRDRGKNEKTFAVCLLTVKKRITPSCFGEILKLRQTNKLSFKVQIRVKINVGSSLFSPTCGFAVCWCWFPLCIFEDSVRCTQCSCRRLSRNINRTSWTSRRLTGKIWSLPPSSSRRETQEIRETPRFVSPSCVLQVRTVDIYIYVCLSTWS